LKNKFKLQDLCPDPTPTEINESVCQRQKVLNWFHKEAAFLLYFGFHFVSKTEQDSDSRLM